MKKPWFSNNPPGIKLLLALGFLVVLFYAIMGIGLLIAIPVFDVSFSEMMSLMQDFSNPKAVALLKYMQVLQSVGLFIVPAVILAYLFNEDPNYYLQFSRSTRSLNIVLAVLIMFSALPLINYLAQINSHLHLPDALYGLEQTFRQWEDNAMEVTEVFLNVETVGGLLFNVFMIAIIPAIGEELLFRGLLQRILADWTKNIHLAVLISAVLFSTFHLQFFGFLPRMLMGVLFGYLLVWSGNMWIPIAAHFANNAIAVVFVYFINKEKLPDVAETIGATNDTQIYTVFSTILLAALIAYFYHENRKSITQ